MVTYDLALPLPATGDVTTSEQSNLASAAETAGYDLVLVPETWGREAFTRLGYLAARTDTIRLGTGIVPVHSRSPALIAQAVATLDELTAGRAVLGLGLSGPQVIENWHGMEFRPALRRQRETIEIVRQVLSGDDVTYDGTLFDLEHFRLRFEPLRSSVRIYVAAQGETNVELAGEFADGWMPNRIPVSSLADVREHVDRGARTRDRDPTAVATIPWVTTCLLEDGERARDRCRETIAFYVGAMGEFHYDAVAEHGFRETADRIRDRWAAGETEAAREAVTDELLDEIAIAGRPDAVDHLFERYEGLADTLALLPPTTASVEEVRETIEHVGSSIA
ncbi:LLM class flavin-dependent oxidoreductase [Natrinema caseinilyticum]|uniref:LLM class flavin-dependent oxidoreductase n=1 Tax=Natrinema caseinilyticum TaxID=2961570 RepID=UPI0020C1E81D|nr:LLM class flavin-dependent oxidoreductase [Natrinema caseinilyticum]